MATPDEKREAAQRLEQVADLEEEAEQAKEQVEQTLEVKLTGVLRNLSVIDESEAIAKICQSLNVNATVARKYLPVFPDKYLVQEQYIPDVIKTMRKERRSLKGEYRTKMSKAIDTLIDGYSAHLEKCVDSIYWLSPYKSTLQKMRYSEGDLLKIHGIKTIEGRRQMIDSLCKYWEAELQQQQVPYGKEYSSLQKTMNNSKREFRKQVRDLSNIRKSIKDETNEFILKAVCNHQGISAREILDSMPSKLFNRNNMKIIPQLVKSLDITDVDGAYYKLDSEIKKNIYAYTAAFIDSDGYITVDRNMNPRVGLVATGDRGKAFMLEIHKALGIGRLHLDQKSPQNTRPVNRLNFYSQSDVTELLTKCLPHFRMKGKNAELLLELIKMKQGYKKADWYKGRCDEIFKLMKYENHKDHVGYDFSKDGIDIETVAKLHDNCKVDLMNEMENLSTPIIKSERTFVIESYSTEEKPYDDIEVNYKATAKELGIEADYTMEDIEDTLREWLAGKIGYFSGYIWHEINDGVKMDWLNPETQNWHSVEKEDLPYGLSWFMKNGKKKFLLDRDGVRHAAGAAVYKGDKILIVERSPEEDSKIGLWEFAGGKIEEVDEFNEDGSPNAEKVCMIEVGEELGLKGTIAGMVGVHLDNEMNPPKKYHCFRINVKEDWNPTLSFEHSDYKWVTLEELKQMVSSDLSHHVRYLMNKL